MYGAGKRFREDAAKYSGSIAEFPLKSATMERGKSMPPDPDSENGQEQAKRDAEGAERFFAADAALTSAGTFAMMSVRDVVEQDLSVAGWTQVLALRKGLLALADHYGLTERANTSNVGKAR